MSLRVRELPPLRHGVLVTTPSGRPYRWADHEPNPRDVPRDIKHESTMPGGYSTFDCALPRKSGIDYADVERLSTAQVVDATGGIVSETRLERAPVTSGDDMLVSPSAVGWQANLDDNKFVNALILDRRLDPWQGMSRARRIALGTAFQPQNDGQVMQDTTTGQPGIKLEMTGDFPGTSGGLAESFYDAGGNLIASVHFEASDRFQVSTGDTNWDFRLHSMTDDNYASAVDETGDLAGTAISFRRETFPTARRWCAIQLKYVVQLTGSNDAERWILVKHIAVVGDHGLTLQEVGAGQDGFLASDIVRYAVEQFAPALRVTSESIEASTFVIPHMDPFVASTAAEIVRQATRFGLQDWAVWDNRTFWCHSRGARGRRWRARIGPSQLEEVGPQIDRLWNSVVVQYRDVDGSTRTVGPPGSSADSEDAVLADNDPENPATKADITRRALLTMGTSTLAGATEIGRRFLEEQKTLDSSGRARFVGHVEDDRGVMHPYSHVRAGDYVSFIDARDASYRRVVRASHDHPSRSCAIDLDSPPEGLAALLERLDVVLAPLGVS